MVSLIRVTFKRVREAAADVATERATGVTAAEEAAAAAGLAPRRKPFFIFELSGEPEDHRATDSRGWE